MTTRQATVEDEPAIMACLEELIADSEFTQDHPVDRDHLAAQLAALLRHPDAGFLIVHRADGVIVGLLVLLLYTHLYSPIRMACQVTWWVSRAYRGGLGVRLCGAGERWAELNGAVYTEMMAPERKFETFFERRGYVGGARVFKRSLPCQR